MGKTETPRNVTSRPRKVGIEVKCDCPVYRTSPNLCQHSLAAAEDMNILPDYIQWIHKTKKTLNLSLLVADHIPTNAGQKPTSRCKGVPKTKKQQPVDDENSSPPTLSTSVGPPDPSSVYNASPGYYSSPHSRASNYSAYSPMPSYYIPPPDTSFLTCAGYGMTGVPAPFSSHPSFLHITCRCYIK